MEESTWSTFVVTARSRVLAAALAALVVVAAPPLLAQGAPLGGTVGASLLAGAATPGKTFPVALVLDLSNETGTCGGSTTVPATLGAWVLGVSYDSSAFQYVGVTSCGVPQFADPLCWDHGTYVQCNDVNATLTSEPRGVVCVARLTFRSLVAGSFPMSVLYTPDPAGGSWTYSRGICTNLIPGCGGPATVSVSAIVPHDAIVVSRSPGTPLPAPALEPAD